MATFLRSSLSVIVPLIKAQIASSVGIDLTYVKVVAGNRKVPFFEGGPDVVLRLGGESPDVGVIDGAGRIDNRRTRTITAECRSRAYLDTVDSDETRLLDVTGLGHILFCDNVVNALELFIAQDGSNNALTLPLRVGRCGDPTPDPQDPTGNWLTSKFTVDVEYELDVDQSIQ